MAEGAWPNLFLVGVVKGGTTSVWGYLNQHPDIFMSPVKEPHYFTDADPPMTQLVKQERAYLQLFADAHEEIRGEASASYFEDPTSPAAIKRASPAAKILVSLRDPVERAYSHYWDTVRYGLERRSFSKAVQDELDGIRPVGLEPYVRGGFYTEPLRRYLHTFGENVHVLFLEEMTRRPNQALREVFDFLEVEAGVADSLTPEHRNDFTLPRVGARWAFGSDRLRRLGRPLIPDRWRTRMESLLLKSGDKPPMDRDVQRLLHGLYERNREPLERLLDRPVPWA